MQFLEFLIVQLIYFSQHQDTTDLPGHNKHRQVIPEMEHKRITIHSCQRCHQSSCPGNSKIDNCPMPCTVPCKICNQLTGCQGVDGG